MLRFILFLICAGTAISWVPKRISTLKLIPRFRIDSIHAHKASRENNSSKKDTIFNRISNQGSNTSQFVRAVKSRAQHDEPLSSDELSSIKSQIQIHVERLDMKQIVTLASSLGLLRNKLKLQDGKIVGLLISRMRAAPGALNATEFVKLMVGLAQLQSNWKQLHKIDNLDGQLVSTISKASSAQLCDLLWSLATMNTRWDNLTGEVQSAIVRRLQDTITQLSAFSASSVVWALAKMGASVMRNGNLPAALSESLIDQISSLQQRLSPQQCSKVLWALGTLGYNYQSISMDLINHLIKTVGDIKKSKMGNAVSASHALIGAAKLGVSWKEIQYRPRPNNRNMVVTAVGSTGNGRTDFSTVASSSTGSNSISSSKKSDNKSDNKSDKRDRRTDHSTKKTKLATAAAAGAMRGALWEQFIRVCQSQNTIGVASAFWAMGTMGATIDTQSADLQLLITSTAEIVMVKCDARSLSNIIWGMARMQYAWSDLPSSFHDSLMMNYVRLAQDMNGADAATLLWGLGELDMPLDTAPVYFRNSVLQNTQRCMAHDMKAQSVAKAVWGLSGAGISWNMMPVELQWSINSALRRVSTMMSPQDVANCAYALGILCFDVENPSDVAFRGVHETMLSTIREAGRDLSIQSAHQTTPSQSISCSSSSGGSSSGSSGSIQQQLPLRHRQELEQLRIFAHYLRTMKYVTDITRIPDHLLSPPQHNNCNNNNNNNCSSSRSSNNVEGGSSSSSSSSNSVVAGLSAGINSINILGNKFRSVDNSGEFGHSPEGLTPASTQTSSSKLQARVIAGLEDALLAVSSSTTTTAAALTGVAATTGNSKTGNEFSVFLEVSSFQGVFPIDAAVSRRGRVIALLEIDGPHHYLQDGRLRRKDQLKEAMYRLRHPGSSFHRIRWDDENKVGSEVIAGELAEILLESARRSDDVVGNSLRQLQQKMGNFFSWSLRNSKEDFQ